MGGWVGGGRKNLEKCLFQPNLNRVRFGLSLATITFEVKWGKGGMQNHGSTIDLV